MKLNVTAFALTCGLVWGIGIFIAVWWVMAFEGATGDVPSLGHIYRGLTVSPLGSIIGCVWGLADGTIGGAIFAWLYNLIAARCPGKKETQS